jgi:hypothetical protein
MKITIIILLALMAGGCVPVLTSKDKIQEVVEEAYFEGQKDAIQGDVRIRKNSDGCWVWTKSCWDNSSMDLIFNPSPICPIDTLNK